MTRRSLCFQHEIRSPFSQTAEDEVVKEAWAKSVGWPRNQSISGLFFLPSANESQQNISRALREGDPAAHPPGGEISISRTRGRLSVTPHEGFTYRYP
jgi:hypothetical protein